MKTSLILFTVFCSAIISCNTSNLYEKVVTVPGHKWKGTYQPSFTFNITDTTQHYQLYIIFRHNNKYNYNNLWLNVYAQTPDSVMHSFNQVELPLATNEKGWIASGMDDIFEHRVAMTLDPKKFNFKKAGTYQFRLAHIMREDPLQHVYNVGVRLEKKPL